ncbi:MAG: hypothetical protein Ct9H300mP1_37260 [Planctomycetaceae bacterium]|nr:MAG: hypothetical protein Ct9H300mP1_37260 [Planctomycetaceae bacterium]
MHGIGDFQVVDLPSGRARRVPIEVQYGYDRSGHINVSAKELVGGTEASVEIHWTDGIDDTALTEFARLARDYDVDCPGRCQGWASRSRSVRAVRPPPDLSCQAGPKSRPKLRDPRWVATTRHRLRLTLW